MWFGNTAQLNSDPTTAMSSAETEPLLGYTASGSDQITPVVLEGKAVSGTRSDAFRTTYNSGKGPATTLTYHQSGAENAVKSVITGFAKVTYRLTMPDGTTRGTVIRTESSDRPVEDLRPGDLVWTRDHGLQPLRWCGSSMLDRDALAARPHLRPIRIAAGALGGNAPAAPLRLSPQHRILVRSSIASRMFGARELLVPAKHLTGLPGIPVDNDGNPVA